MSRMPQRHNSRLGKRSGFNRVEDLEARHCLAGLVAAFGFDEGSGATAQDASLFNHSGAISGATWTTSGRFGGALSFDGVNDLVTVADHASLDLTTAMTLEAWVRPTNFNGWETVLLKEAGTDLAYSIYADNNGNDSGGPRRPAAWIRQGSTSYSTAGAAQLPLNTWTHLASTYDGATLRLFVNGTQVSSLARSGAVNTSTGALRIGGNTIWSEWFQGEIDELRIYDRVLSAAEIQADMNTAITPTVDVVPPTVLSTTPSHGATGVAVNSAMTITFSEPMDAATIHTGTITLVDAVGTPVGGSVIYDPATRTASLTPLSPLAPGAAYTLTVEGGAAAPYCTDVAGNPLANDVTVAFTTAPLAISISDVSVTEGNSGEVQAVFLVSLSAASASPVTVNYATTNGEAAGGADYIAQSTTELRFEPGQLSQTITVRVIGDTVGEANETFFVDLSAPNGAVLADARGVGTILDDDGVLLGSEGFGYTAYTHTFEPLDLVPGANGVITVRATGNNNASQVTLPAGNSFNFYGVSFTSFHVSTNGLITFGTAVTSANNTNLTSSPSQRAIAPLWDDWLNTTGNAILLAKYEDLTGDGVNDRLILEWNNVQGSTSSPSPVTFQTILELNTGARAGAITFNYVDLDSGNARSDGASSTVGIKDTGTQGTRRLLISQNAVNPNIASGKAIRILPDAIAPSVSLTAPADGATLTGVVTVSASAADNVGVAGVQFLLDGVPLGSEDTSAPYSIAWDTSAVTSGFHVLSARARDAQGNTSTAPLSNVTVVPRLIITSPAAGAVVQGDTVNITYTTAGNLSGVAVHHVHFSLDGGPEIMDVDFDGSRQLTNISPGTHTLTGILVRADHSDILGTEAVPVTFTVTASDTTAPTVAVTSPIDGSNVTGNVVLAASASDDVGVAGVQFLVDGVAVGAEVTAAPYVLSWNSSTVAAGAHTITARARDAAGNVTTSTSVSVNVINANDPALIGQWSSPVDLPLVAINMTLLHDGRVLMWDGGPECIGSTSARVWDPVSGVTTHVPIPYFSHQDDDIFCSAQVLLPDGRVMVIGGHDCDGPHLGIAMVNFFDPRTMTWTRGPDMDFRRWYPTATLLANGKVLVTGGSVFTTTDYVPIPELYDPVTNTWTRLDAANAVIPNYAFMFQMPDGRMLAAGSDEAKMATRILDLNTQTWSTVDPTILDAGSAVMYLPGKVMKTGSSYLSPPADNGGSVPSAATTYVLDMTAPSPAWQQTESMEFPRTHLNLTILPDGTVLATGGSTDIGGVNPANAVYAAELWDPATQTWTTLSSAQVPRLYHSTATLLPDGRVVSAGGGHNYFNNIAYPNAEFFSPPYLFQGARPAVTSAPEVLNYSANFFVATPDAADIAKVSLIRNGSVTHAFNMEQRYVPLSFSTASGGLNITAPADASLAPPGTYMLFLVNWQGVPSIASFVNLPTTPADVTPPAAPANLTANGGLGVVALSWDAATDNVAVTGYNVYRSATPSFTPTPANRIGQSITTAFQDTSGAGTYYYRVTANDAAGNESGSSNEAAGTFAADTQYPTATLTSPSNGATVSGTVSVSATATDNVAVVGVQFLLNGNPLGAEDTTAPYALSWNTATVANGVYSLSARARDAAGNSTTSASIDVTVNNVAISGLVSAYDFNAGAGASAVDATGNGFNAQISGATWTTDGRFGNALAFNGLNSVLTVSDANALDLTNGMTLEAWVKPAALNDWKTVLLKERPGGLAYALYASDGASRPPAGYINRSGADVSAIGTSTLPLNAWTHLAVTYDASALRLYVNGTQVATRSQTGNITTSTGALRIGGNSVWGEYFNGVIDEVRIYNRALTATEIQTDMNAPIGGAAPLTSAATTGDWGAAGAARLLREQSTDYLFTSEAFSPQIPIAPSTASTSFDRVKNIRRDAVSPAVRPRTANSLSPPGAHSRLADALGESRATAPTWRADQTLVFESFFELLEMRDAQTALTSTLKKQ